MKRSFRGLLGLFVGAILFLPSFLINHMFELSGAAESTVIRLFEVAGILVMVAAPLLLWVVLPYIDRHQRKGLDE